jgi:acyl dehydratase
VPHVHTVLQRNVPERALAENRSVHGEHDIHYYQPLRPGSTLSVRGRLYGGQPKSTGTTLVTHVEMTDADTGRLVQVQYFVNFLRGVTIEEPLGEAPLAHRLPDAAILGMPAGTTTYHIDADQTYRYAEASGDHSIYHLDNAAARAAGFDGIIVHGLCTMALAGRVVVAGACEDDASRLRRLAVRFSRPMYPGRSMTTTLWAAPPDGDSPAEFRFQVADDQGAVVITDGLALVAPIGEEGTTR